MNSRAESSMAGGSAEVARPGRTLVWDLPVRVFHWTLVASFVGAYLTADSERWRDIHVLLGYTAGILVVFRILWGLVGTRYARFASFLYRPGEVFAYVRALLARRPAHFVGHNPAGALAIFLLLGLVGAAVLSGWAALVERGPTWLQDAHDALGDAALAVVVVHLGGVAVSSWLHRENLVRAMVTGYKPVAAPPAAGLRGVVALALLVVIGAMWSGVIPVPGLPAGTAFRLSAPQAPTAHAPRRPHKDDD